MKFPEAFLLHNFKELVLSRTVGTTDLFTVGFRDDVKKDFYFLRNFSILKSQSFEFSFNTACPTDGCKKQPYSKVL